MDNFDLKKYLAEGKLLKEEVDVNKILSDGGYDIIDDEELLMTVKSRLKGNSNIDAEKLNLLVMKIEDEEGGNIDFSEGKLFEEEEKLQMTYKGDPVNLQISKFGGTSEEPNETVLFIAVGGKGKRRSKGSKSTLERRLKLLDKKVDKILFTDNDNITKEIKSFNKSDFKIKDKDLAEGRLLKENQLIGKYIETKHPEGYDMIMSFSMPDEGELGLDYGTLDEILEVKEINGVKVYCVYI